MNKVEEYEKMIKDIAQLISLDKELKIGEVVALFDLMKRSGEAAIRLFAGEQYSEVIELLSQSK